MTSQQPDRRASASTYRASGAGLADPENMSPRLRRRRAISLILMTLVAPGSAQLVAGNKALGRLGLRVWVSLIGVVLVLAVLGLVNRSILLSIFTRSWVLLVVTIVLSVFAVLWAVLFVDAVRLTRMQLLPTTTRRIVAGLTAAMVLVTSGGLLWSAANVNAGRGLVAQVFGDNVATAPEQGRYNVLLLGGDSGKARSGTRPDSIMLASVDADTGKTVMFGFTRDTEYIRFRPGSVMAKVMPEGWVCGHECLLNGLYTWATDNKAKFPKGTKNPGIVATTEAVESLSGLDINYYVLVDLKGFESLIDAVGGIEVTVQRKTPIGGIGAPVRGYIKPGRQVLDGNLALWYARSRVGSDNYERMARQRCVIDAMARQLNPTTVITKFQGIADASGRVVQTDIPESDLGTLADLALKSRQHKVKTINFVPPLIKPWNYDPEFVRSTVATAIQTSEAASTGSASSTPKPKPSTFKGTNVDNQSDDLSATCA